MFDYFEPGKDYTADSFKIVNQNYLFVCKKKKVSEKKYTYENFHLYSRKKIKWEHLF